MENEKSTKQETISKRADEIGISETAFADSRKNNFNNKKFDARHRAVKNKYHSTNGIWRAKQETASNDPTQMPKINSTETEKSVDPFTVSNRTDGSSNAPGSVPKPGGDAGPPKESRYTDLRPLEEGGEYHWAYSKTPLSVFRFSSRNHYVYIDSCIWCSFGSILLPHCKCFL